MLNYRNELDKMPSYDGVEKSYRIKVNANESTLSLPPLVEERVLNRLGLLAFNRYPNEEYYSLVEQIARNFSVDASQVLLGGGSSEIIEKVFHAFGGAGHAVVYPQPSFSMYKIYAKAAEADGVPFDLDAQFNLNVDEFIKKIREVNASLAVVCNPNNPTGNVLTPAQVEKIAASIDCAFLLDEAYVEFYGRSAVNLVKRYPNLIVARTFSKAYGMAGARVGYMIAQPGVTRMINKCFMPYHMNVLTLAAADVVYQMRDEFVPRLQMIIAERKRMDERLKTLPGVEVFPSEANFILIRLEAAQELKDYLETLGIGIRYFSPSAFGLKNCLRISIGTRTENDEVFSAIKSFLEAGQ
ncbi:MAG: histidinol-phosphate transaminase [Selenomonadaceae bacterium]|nr:histidinol-phosphate transaminase [Selenomonadaceae bacterium]